MRKFFFFALFLFVVPFDASSRAVKLGDLAKQPTQRSFKTGGGKAKIAEISCFENEDCSYDKECVALRCESVCKSSICLEGTYCAPAGKDKPHEFKCVECTANSHCPEGLFCGADYTCQKPDPCLKAVCSPAAPFCMPKPYKSLPYTCVQCLENEHCPPVAGLTRSCVDGYCLFNVEGNIPAAQKKETTPDAVPADSSPVSPEVPLAEEEEEEEPEEIGEEYGY